MYCVFNENLITKYAVTHTRQFKESRDGKRLPLLRDGRAVIEYENGLYVVRQDGGMIAASTDIDTVVKRIKKADRNAEIKVKYQGHYLTVDAYKLRELPTIYRLAYSDTKEYGVIIALDWIEDIKQAAARLFHDFDEVIKFIESRQRQDDNYYVYYTRLPREFSERLGGLQDVEMPAGFKTVVHLRNLIEEHKKSDSHKAEAEYYDLSDFVNIDNHIVHDQEKDFN